MVVAPSEVVACSSSCASSSSSTFSVVGERETERGRERERGVKNVRFLFVEEESTQNAFAARPLFEKRRRQKRKTSTENKMSTPRYTRPRERTFAAIFGFILDVVVVVIEFLSHSRGVGQSFDTDEIFSRFGAPLHFACKKHTFWRKKKAARFEEKWSRRERGNARTGSKTGVARTSPGDAIICAAFFSVVVVVLLAKRRAFLCGVRKLNAKQKNVGTKNDDDEKDDDDERKAKERPDDFIIIIIVVPLNCSRRRRSSSYGTSTHRIQKSLLLLILFPLVLTRRAPKKLRHWFVGASRLDQQKVRDVVGAFWTSTARRVDVFPRVVAP